MAEEIQKQMQSEFENFKAMQKEYVRLVMQRQQLDAQMNENTAVKKELDLMKDDADVFKLIGPVLIKQELDEAKQNVSKRLDYINGELKRIDDLISSAELKREGHKQKIEKFQKQLQEAKAKMLNMA
ncbi:prefoldin subunit 6 [Nilaparvata lugens]|uniref:prefoldin subunit 6 n=1 Tax=Nilaparvata lugens TaxID=108931 RepID=UPI000B97FC7E|nr:prefoldin subunit 6 [Nilaparvata lugens]